MNKPICVLTGEDGNIFNLLAVAGRALKSNGMKAQFEEMKNKVFKSGSYEEALGIIGDYVEIV